MGATCDACVMQMMWAAKDKTQSDMTNAFFDRATTVVTMLNIVNIMTACASHNSAANL